MTNDEKIGEKVEKFLDQINNLKKEHNKVISSVYASTNISILRDNFFRDFLNKTSVKLDLTLRQMSDLITEIDKEIQQNQQKHNEEQKTPKITLNATQIAEQAKTKTLQQVQSNNTEENTVKKGRGR